MNKHNEVIFNLLILHYWGDFCGADHSICFSECYYNYFITLENFKAIKSCFPIGEICIEHLEWVNEYEFYHFGQECKYKRYIYSTMREV